MMTIQGVELLLVWGSTGHPVRKSLTSQDLPWFIHLVYPSPKPSPNDALRMVTMKGSEAHMPGHSWCLLNTYNFISPWPYNYLHFVDDISENLRGYLTFEIT
jgi:hypothetical protein